MKKLYPAIIDKDPDSDFGISFPDFPGCISAGTTPEEAIAMGTEAINGHVAVMAQDGDDIPVPTPVELVKLDPDINVICLTLIPVTIPGRAKRINISLDESLIEDIDGISHNRSGFLAEAAREKLARMRSA